jgi:hypothetical protein
MNKLRESFYKEVKFMERAEKCEQITDDFSVKFVKWYNVSKYDFPNEMTIEEKQKYFKENVYGKEI